MVKDKITRRHVMVSCEPLFEMAKQLGYETDAGIAAALQISTSGVHDIREAGVCKPIYLYAMECLVRRQGPGMSKLPQPWVLVIKGSTDSEKLAITGVAKAIGVKVVEA